jgi:hypothetical protein
LVSGRNGTARSGDTRWQQLAEARGRQRKIALPFRHTGIGGNVDPSEDCWVKLHPAILRSHSVLAVRPDQRSFAASWTKKVRWRDEVGISPIMATTRQYNQCWTWLFLPFRGAVLLQLANAYTSLNNCLLAR